MAAGKPPGPAATHKVTERWLRQELIALREKKGWTRGQLSRATGLYLRTIERVENGPEPVSAKSLAALMHVYGGSRTARDRLRDMQELSRIAGWWDPWADILPAEYADHCELETLADSMVIYSPMFYHGLTQSPEYARHLQQGSRGLDLREGVKAERFIELRMERQRQCWDRGVPMRVMIDEGAKMWTPPDIFPIQVDYMRSLQEKGCIMIKHLPLRTDFTFIDSIEVMSVRGRRVMCLGSATENHTNDDKLIDAYLQVFETRWEQLPLLESDSDWEKIL